jgi:hypothetical protein
MNRLRLGRTLVWAWAILLLGGVLGSAWGAEGFPDPNPVFEGGTVGRRRPELVVDRGARDAPNDQREVLVEKPSLRVGNKVVAVRWSERAGGSPEDHVISIVVDRETVGRIVFWGDDGAGNYGYPFKELGHSKPSLQYDEAAESITYKKPYRARSGQEAVFSYTLRAVGDSRVELSWTLGRTEEDLAANPQPGGLGLWMSFPRYRDVRVDVGGKRLVPADVRELRELKSISHAAAGSLDYATDDPPKGFRVEGDGLKGDLRETLEELPGGEARYLLEYRVGYPGQEAENRLVIDLGEAAFQSQDVPAPVGGLDFWAVDATHVPRSPVRNVMPNPSFEQGLRYWTWMDGGARYEPSTKPRYEVVPEGCVGPSALLIREAQPDSAGMVSFPVPLEHGEVYTLSFHARANADSKLVVSLLSAGKAGKFNSPRGPWGDVENPDASFTIGRQWRRYSRTFKADVAGIRVGIMATRTTLIDGIQLEKGQAATDFVGPPLDGFLTTADPDNALAVGQPVAAAFTCTGLPGTRGVIVLAAKNAFGELVYQGRGRIVLGRSGVQSVPLPIDGKRLGEGVFVVQATYEMPDSSTYVDYHRFSIIRPLSNQHATKDLCGTIGLYDRISRGEDLARRLMEWGFGSTSWGYDADQPGERVRLEEKYRITNVANVLETKDSVAQGYMEWQTVSDDLERRIEDAAYRHARRYDPRRDRVWAFGNEEEGSYLVSHGLFEEHLRAQLATARGVLRAIPNAIMLPTCGTSGYSRLRGYDAMEGYLKAATHAGWRYGGIAVHPYGSIDGGTLSMHDLDEETARLLEQMRRFGYGPETPIFYTEMFNVPETYMPAWKADTCYDDYGAGKPTYDFGNREFLQAASAARAIVIMAKYWPQLRSANLWVSKPFMDMRLTPLLLCKAINTLGWQMSEVRHLADIKPSPKIRGYVFERPDGTGVAAVWCIDRDVERGFRRGPRIRVPFSQRVSFRDFMGCERDAEAAQDGFITIPLTSAPLFISGDDAAALARDLASLTHDDATLPLQVVIQPESAGGLNCVVRNRTGTRQAGHLTVAGQEETYALEKGGEVRIQIKDGPRGNEPGRLNRWSSDVVLQQDSGKVTEMPLEMSYFYVPRIQGDPDWSAVAPLELDGRLGANRDHTARAFLRMAWDDEALRLCVDVEGDGLRVPERALPGGERRGLQSLGDPRVELYLDTAANGRISGIDGLDHDDYQYEFGLLSSNEALGAKVKRVRGVYHQLADGVNMPTDADVAEDVPCSFAHTGKGYRLTLTLPQRFVLPVTLKAGAAFGVNTVVREDGPSTDSGPRSNAAGLVAATDDGASPKPFTWPVAVLAP